MLINQIQSGKQLGLYKSHRPGLGCASPAALPVLCSLSKFHLLPSEALKTAADQQAEDKVLRKLVDVVNQRDALIRFQEERRLSELPSGPGPQG